MAPSIDERERAPEPRGRLINRSPELAQRRAVQGRASDISAWSCSLGASPLQLRAFDHAMGDLHDAIAVGNHDVWGDPLPPHLQRRATRDQRHDDAQSADAHSLARDGVAGPGGALPHADELQAAFGRHDLGGVRAHVGGQAAKASEALGAHGYTTGSDIAFARSPDLHLAAHEAAHVIQQRAGVNLGAGIGQVGDRYERHADEVADAVVQGRSAEPILDRMARGGGGGGAVTQRRALQLEGPGQPDRSMPDGTTSDGDTTYAPGTLPAAEAEAPARPPVQQERRVQGMSGFASWLGDTVLAAVPTAGSALAGNFTARVSLEGVVFSVVLVLSARRAQDGTISMNASASFGIGLGTAENNGNVQASQGIEMQSVAANANAVGLGISQALRNHLINLGDGILPDPALNSLMNALLGPGGTVVMAADAITRGVYGLWEGADRIRNPTYRWLADQIWGPRFAQVACRAMGEGASVESHRGVGAEVRGATGTGDRRVAGSARAQVEQVRTTSCGEDGQVTEEGHTEGSTVIEMSVSGFVGRVSIQWTPAPETTILLQATIEGVDAASARMIDALVECIGATMDHFRQRRLPEPSLTRATVTAAVNQAFTNAPAIQSARARGRSDVQFSVELRTRADGNRLRVGIATVAGVRNQGDGAVASVSGTLTNSQSFDVDF